MEKSAGANIATRRLDVLLADPTLHENSRIVRRLKDEGFRVHLASSVHDARMYASHREISFALLEVRFPDGNGLSLVREIRQANADARILIHSAYCNVALAVAATKAGATDVLPKPVETGFVVQLLLGRGLELEGSSEALPCPNAIRKEHIHNVFADCDWNVSQAARQLSMHRRTLQRMMRFTHPTTTPALR